MIKGFKVFNSDWSCEPDPAHKKQYTCPGKFEEDVDPEVCECGIHFCERAADCFRYYPFDPANKVAEVIAYGKVVTDGVKSATNKIEIVREIPWDEVLRLVNTGKDCTGLCNTGDLNAGHRNAGNRNIGSWNTGHHNSGCMNTGSGNIGYWNTGHANTGDSNTGNRNTGDLNTGNHNAGSYNTGSRNTGDRNTGDWNTGDNNTGCCNIGDNNTGDWNKSSFNTGCFMTKEQKIMMFNKPSDWTYRMWWDSEARYLLNQIPKVVVEWVYSEDMSDEEKAAHPEHETTGGYLKVLDESERVQIWWDGLPEQSKEIIMALPNFDKDIFNEITGINVEK